MNVIIALPSFRAAKCKNSCISKNQAVEVVEVTELGIQNEEWEREEASAYAGAVLRLESWYYTWPLGALPITCHRLLRRRDTEALQSANKAISIRPGNRV